MQKINIDDQFAEKINQLTLKNRQLIIKLVCLCAFCPAFNEALKMVIPAGAISREQFTRVGALVDKWLYKEGWGERIRSELEREGLLQNDPRYDLWG